MAGENLSKFRVENFTGNAGAVMILDAESKEADFFNLMFPDNIFEEISVETNRYAEQDQKTWQ